MGLNDPLFNAAWSQAVSLRRSIERARSDLRAERNRNGENGAFCQAFQLEIDAVHASSIVEIRRGTYCDTIVFDEAA